MFVFRVTKYDPAHRDRHGAYTRDDWISVSDIGRAFAGVVLTETEYRRVEDAYTTAAVAFLREAGGAVAGGCEAGEPCGCATGILRRHDARIG